MFTSSCCESVSSCSCPSAPGGSSNQLRPNASRPSSRRTNFTMPERPPGSSSSRCTTLYAIVLLSHAEDAERRLGDRRVERGREAEREDAPRVERVDDPVVPEPRGGVVRAPLAVVGLADPFLVDV